VLLGQVQAQGKQRMDATAWARGVHPTDEDELI
jgi:hypothetical protein